MYKEFIVEEQFEGTLFNLLGEIVEAFVREGVVRSKFGEFYNIAGLVTLEEYGHITFNEYAIQASSVKGCDAKSYEDDMDGFLREDIIRQIVVRHILHKVSRRSIELIDNGQIKASQAMMLDSNIKATYTLMYS